MDRFIWIIFHLFSFPPPHTSYVARERNENGGQPPSFYSNKDTRNQFGVFAGTTCSIIGACIKKWEGNQQGGMKSKVATGGIKSRCERTRGAWLVSTMNLPQKKRSLVFLVEIQDCFNRMFICVSFLYEICSPCWEDNRNWKRNA